MQQALALHSFGDARPCFSVKILLVEDDRDTANYVANGLRQAGNWVEVAADGPSGASAARTRVHDVAVVDRMLPGLEGIELVRTLRSENIEIPILLLTTMSGVRDRVDGLEAGADDYLTKPFALAELVARINSLARRTKRVSAEIKTHLQVADIEMDLSTRSVARAGRRIDLQPQEFRVLEYLMRHAGQIVTRTMLLENVWQLHFDPQTNIVESHMSRLRAKLDRDTEHEAIQTVRGAGYMLRAD